MGAGRCLAVPLFGADVQRPPHSLRPALCDAGGRLPGTDRARTADRDVAARSAAPRAPRGGRRTLRIPRDPADLRSESVLRLWAAAGGWQDDQALVARSRGVSDDGRHGDAALGETTR